MTSALLASLMIRVMSAVSVLSVLATHRFAATVAKVFRAKVEPESPALQMVAGVGSDPSMSSTDPNFVPLVWLGMFPRATSISKSLVIKAPAAFVRRGVELTRRSH